MLTRRSRSTSRFSTLRSCPFSRPAARASGCKGRRAQPGRPAHNMDLSRRRADKVADHLRSCGVADEQMQVDAVGESLASTTVPENADDRAVSLLAAPLFSPPPPRPDPPRPKPVPTVTSFQSKPSVPFPSGRADPSSKSFSTSGIKRTASAASMSTLECHSESRPGGPRLPWRARGTTSRPPVRSRSMNSVDPPASRRAARRGLPSTTST